MFRDQQRTNAEGAEGRVLKLELFGHHAEGAVCVKPSAQRQEGPFSV